VRHRPDDVLGPERGVAAEEHLGVGRGHGCGVDLGHGPFVELDADVALDPGERVLLADRDQHIVTWNMLVGLARRHQAAPALGVILGLHLLEHDAGELPLSWVNSFGTRKLRIGMSSCMASSFSQGDAFISSKPERTITLTSSRRAGARNGSSPWRCCHRRAR